MFKADEEGKRALNEDPELIEQVKTHFGEGIYGPKGLDRKGLGRIVFANASENGAQQGRTSLTGSRKRPS